MFLPGQVFCHLCSAFVAQIPLEQRFRALVQIDVSAGILDKLTGHRERYRCHVVLSACLSGFYALNGDAHFFLPPL
jgi:hypothetical protein